MQSSSLNFLVNPLYTLFGFFRSVFPAKTLKPEHIRLSVTGSSIEDCLRKLEKKAGLSAGDLFIDGTPMEVVTFPLPKKGLVHGISSKMSDVWQSEGKGYIAGQVFESVSSNMLTATQRQNLSPLASAAVALADSVSYYGKLHISKNCPGVYRDSVCTTCGDVSK